MRAFARNCSDVNLANLPAYRSPHASHRRLLAITPKNLPPQSLAISQFLRSKLFTTANRDIMSDTVQLRLFGMLALRRGDLPKKVVYTIARAFGMPPLARLTNHMLDNIAFFIKYTSGANIPLIECPSLPPMSVVRTIARKFTKPPCACTMGLETSRS